MQDVKALQAGTSHFLGQNFAKAFDVKFSDKNNKLDYVWAASWGVSTRLIGALVMAHSDDDGLILPPKIAPQQVVIVPIYKNEEQKKAITQKVKEIIAALKQMNIRVKYDDNDNMRPGWKFAEYEMKGVPVRITIGPKDLENNAAEVARRDLREKKSISLDTIANDVVALLDDIQNGILNKAKKFLDEHITEVNTWEEFQEVLENKT